jgi:hypothetical protein
MRLQTVILLVFLVLQGCIDEVSLSLKPLDYRFFDTDYIATPLDRDIPPEICDSNQANWTRPTLHEGVCKNLSKVCKNGFYQEPDYQAVLNYEQNEKSCDLLDNDCDGKVDENLDEDISCGVGACENRGQRRCINGQIVSQCVAKPIMSQDDSSCNGMDEDCDGLNDNDFIPIPIDCGEGSCSASGFNNCINGEIQSTCQPLAAARVPNDANCDAIDEDCDGFLDEDYEPKTIMCNQGACQRMGTRICRNGQLQDQCERVLPQPGEFDTSCNGIDDDCDGRVDESYIPVVVSCGIGVCVARGTKTCNNGEEVEQCEPLRPFASDFACNGLDEDCNGINDEDFVRSTIECGIGTCRSTGEKICSEGREINNCIPRTGNDEICNGIDDDCDQRIDEIIPEMTTCGSGVCINTGFKSCIEAMEVNSCQPHMPTGLDDNCNGVDEDCDNRIDEHYVSTPTSCGVGLCANTGNMVCRDGREFNSCEPGQPQDEVCDGIDNNCDGLIDQGVGMCILLMTTGTSVDATCMNASWTCRDRRKICDTGCN